MAAVAGGGGGGAAAAAAAAAAAMAARLSAKHLLHSDSVRVEPVNAHPGPWHGTRDDTSRDGGGGPATGGFEAAAVQ